VAYVLSQRPKLGSDFQKELIMPTKELNLAEKTTKKDNVITVDGRKFDAASLSEQAKAQLESLQFVNEQILQKNNELQIADSARVMYTHVLNEELIKTKA
jgi:hypothetical protein